MHSYLSLILEKKQQEIQHLYQTVGLQGFNLPQTQPRFLQALSASGFHLIAEVKKASPSKGVIREQFDPLALAKEFRSQGASALSVLTEMHYFLGNPTYIQLIKSQVNLPVLRKDFIIDPIQVYESKQLGADALLLIKAILSQEQSQSLLTLAESVGLDVLMEIHNEEELEAVTHLRGKFAIGINNRNLKTFAVDLQTALNLGKQIRHLFPAETVLVAESGYTSETELEPVRQLPFSAVLIGEGLAKYPSLFNALTPE